MLCPIYALAYAQTLPTLRKIAREHGYALALHGSMATDLDLVAIPWVEDASESFVLVEAIREAVDGVINMKTDHNPSWKPHGRLAWVIYPRGCDSVYIDISVMPRRRDGEHYDNDDLRRTEEKFKHLYEKVNESSDTY